MVSIINNLIFCATALIMALMILLAMPKSMLRCVLLEIAGWAGTVLAGLYILSPIDLIPDFIPVAGWIDDGGALIGGVASAVAALSARSDRNNLRLAKTQAGDQDGARGT